MIEAVEPRCHLSHTLTTAQRAAINQLGNELVALHTAHKIPQAVVRSVYSDLLLDIELAHAPNAAVAKQAVSDAAKAFKDGVLTSNEKTALAASVGTVLRSAGISKALSRQSATDVNTLFHEPGLTTVDTEQIYSTLIAIGDAFKK